MIQGPHLGFSSSERDLIATTAIQIGEMCGMAIEQEEVGFVGLKRDHYSTDCLKLEAPNGALHYVEYPFAYGEGDHGERGLRCDFHGEVFVFLLERLQTDLRKRCLTLDPTPLAHDDGTWNTIWNERLVAQKPELQSGMSAKDGYVEITTSIGRPGSKTTVQNDSITIPHLLPNAIVSRSGLRRLDELIDMPDCGDPEVQREFLAQYVYGIELGSSSTTLKTSCSRHPVRGQVGVYPWRTLRKMRGETHLHVTGWDPVTYDVEADSATFRRKVADFFAQNGPPEDWYAQKRRAA